MSEFETHDPEAVQRALNEYINEYDTVEGWAEGIKDPLPRPEVDFAFTDQDIIDQW